MKLITAAILVTLLMLTTLPGQSAEQYRVTGVPVSAGLHFVHAINNSNQIVGEGYDYAFLWEDGNLTKLGYIRPPLSYQTAKAQAWDINDHGDIVGLSVTTPGFSRAFLWRDGVMTDLTPSSYIMGRALGINNLGDITGELVSQDGLRYGALWTDNTIVNMGNGAVGKAVNDKRQVTGSYKTAQGIYRAFLWEDGRLSDLETPAGEDSLGNSINNNGDVVGYSSTSSQAYKHALLWRNGVMTDLGHLGVASSTAYDINDSGLVVGISKNNNAESRAFLWSDGLMTDINTLISPDSGWILEGAVSINNSGNIVGYGNYNGQYQVFLLTPVPEPSSLLTLICGLGGVGGMIWRRRR